MQTTLFILMLMIADPTQEQAAIQRVLDDQAAAWNKGDLPGFMKGYLESDKLSFFSNTTKTAGWKATLERYQKRSRAKSLELLADSKSLREFLARFYDGALDIYRAGGDEASHAARRRRRRQADDRARAWGAAQPMQQPARGHRFGERDGGQGPPDRLGAEGRVDEATGHQRLEVEHQRRPQRRVEPEWLGLPHDPHRAVALEPGRHRQRDGLLGFVGREVHSYTVGSR